MEAKHMNLNDTWWSVKIEYILNSKGNEYEDAAGEKKNEE